MPSDAASPAQTADDVAGLRSAYLDAVLEPDPRRARGLALDALDAGLPAARLYLDVLQPAMHDVGELWERARISVAAEHLATQITQTVLAAAAERLAGPLQTGGGRVALSACTPGERHALGAQMVADFLEADGWRVLVPGPDLPAEELARLAERHDAAVVALSTALPQNLLAARHAFAVLRRLPGPVLLVAGGRAYGGDAERAGATGADVFAEDPGSLLALLAERLAPA